MHWIVNACLSRELGFDALIASLAARKVPFTLVKKPPFADYLINDNGEPITLDTEGPVFVAGTTSMGAVSRNHGWTPGYIEGPNFQACLANWGTRMLNSDSVVDEIRNLEAPEGHFFIRPCEDMKAFAGAIYDRAAFNEFKAGIMAIGGEWTTIPQETKFQIATIKQIWSEYRCMMVNGKYVTGSRYRTAGRADYSPDVGKMIIDYAEDCATEWNPADAYALDIAHTPKGLKIIEVNSISSAGFYACDMDKFVVAINDANFSAPANTASSAERKTS